MIIREEEPTNWGPNVVVTEEPNGKRSVHRSAALE